ncbi:MAG: HAD family hydrolase [Spiribacter sp.]|nr:HAD family hydrolase [Spiribacter sp.]
MTVQLAIFDLDNTLLGGDSDYLWGQHLMDKGAVSRERFEVENQRFMEQYEAGELDIDTFLAFALAPLAQTPKDTLLAWRREFIDTHIRPRVLPAAQALVDDHRARGHGLMIITATNRFVTEPIAELFNIPILLATEPEMHNGAFTGRHQGTPTFREGKITALQHWLDAEGAMMEAMHFYSDSRNDLPLLEHVDHPVAVDPDPTLEAAARARGWPVLTLRSGEVPQALP